MQITIGLDLSSKTGFAVFHDTALVRSGTLWPEQDIFDINTIYPFNLRFLVEGFADRIVREVVQKERWENEGSPIHIVCEELTVGSEVTTQKRLHWLHLALLQKLEKYNVTYTLSVIRDGVWKRLTGANQTKTERNWNARISRYKKKNDKKIAKLVTEPGGKAHRVRRLDSKDYAIRAAKEIYGIDFKREQEDECDAILLTTAFLWGAPCADGTPEGGVLTDEIKEQLLAKKCSVSRG